MTAQSSIFPAFIRAEYDGTGNGFSLFEKEAGESASRVRRQFEANFAEVERVVNGALSRGLKPTGAMDLGVDGFRQAAAQAKAYELSLRTTREAAQNLALSTGDTSAATQSYIQALGAQVVEATRARQEADAQVTTYTRLQAEIDATASRNTALAASYRELYAEQARAARDEVRGRRAQEGYNEVFAPGLARTSAIQNGAGFEALEQQARDMERYAQAAAVLRGELDPMYQAQQRFNQALDTADDLLKQNIIDERLHAAAVQHARDQLQAHSNAIHAQNDGYQQLVRGSGVLRQAYIQTGQQGQDLIISLIGGQKASVVFAQQLPQLAFALSGLGMQADGTQKGIGRIATLLSGPWGIAFAGAAFAVGLLVEKLWQQDEASKEAEKAVKQHAAAIDQLNEAMERSVQTAEDKARADFIELENERAATIEIRKRTAAMLEQAKARLALADKQGGDGSGEGGVDFGTTAGATQEAEIKRLEAALKRNQEEIDRLTRTTTIARGQYQMQILDQISTPEGRAKRRWDNEINDAISSGKSAAELERLRSARDAEIAKIRETEKASRDAASARDKETATVSQMSKVILKAFGGTITSTTGGKHVDGSDHYKGRAIDFVPAGGMGSLTKDMIRQVFADAGVSIRRNARGVEQLFGPGDKGHNDHYHVAWEGGRNAINSQRINDQLQRAAERAAEEAKRQAEELQRAAESLFSKFDEGRASALEYAQSLSEIDRVMRAGVISPDDAVAYSIAAAQRKTANDNQREKNANEALDKALWDGRKRPTDQFNEQQEAAYKRQAEAAREAQRQIDIGLRHIADFFGKDVAKILDRLTANAGPDSELGKLLGGFGAGKQKMWDGLGEQLGGILKKSGFDSAGIGSAIGQVMAGAQMGKLFGKGLTDVFGIKGSKLGSEIGGAIGSQIGGPLGAIVGGTLGSIAGGLLKTPKWGTAVLTGNGKDDVSVAGNKSAYRDNAGLAGTSIQTGLDRIAEQFGVDVGGYQVSIGQYKGKWRVSTTGREGKLKGGAGRTDIKDFGKEGGEDAIKFAISDAVKDGALLGLRASTQVLLSRTADVEAQLQKAIDFEGVFSRLKSYKDPVAAALDTLDKEFGRLKKIFGEAGASAEEYAQLEELYGIERANAVKEAGEKVTASLKSLFDELTVGNDARSLRDRLAEAQAKYDPLAQRVAAGDTTAYDDYSDAARTMLDLQRQISGSGEDYFKLLDQVTALTKARIDSETNVASIASARPGLFASDSSLAPVVSATETQTAQIVSALKANNNDLLTAMNVQNSNIVALVRAISLQSGGSGTSGLTAVRQNF
ncbi:hypothetical protein SAMIE_1015520 [Sphingobium amiense]|uniref:Bacteriophage tail tape measure N-terminal domain-containing protein n=1 Tax=Sphingobium amiense TaxID=135719 RepID=A0A494W1H4_9SPHN|nr:hypothetical protein [Sphingobium amiense]BBD98051.1 hypothetical protein SAMIE_1015520 [Sphingobium amiense]